MKMSNLDTVLQHIRKPIKAINLNKLIRSYVLVFKRCIAPSYDSLFAQKFESHIIVSTKQLLILLMDQMHAIMSQPAGCGTVQVASC